MPLRCKYCFRMDLQEYLPAFLKDARGQLSQMQTALKSLGINQAEAMTIIHRGFHTLGGTAGTMQIQPLYDLCLRWEATVKILKDSGAAVSADDQEALSGAMNEVEAEIAKITP